MCARGGAEPLMWQINEHSYLFAELHWVLSYILTCLLPSGMPYNFILHVWIKLCATQQKKKTRKKRPGKNIKKG